MNSNASHIFFALILQFCAVTLNAQEKMLILEQQADQHVYQDISRYLLVLPDPSAKLKINDISSPSFANQFQANNNQWLNAPVKTHWLKLTIKNNLPSDKELLAYIQGSIVELFE